MENRIEEHGQRHGHLEHILDDGGSGFPKLVARFLVVLFLGSLQSDLPWG